MYFTPETCQKERTIIITISSAGCKPTGNNYAEKNVRKDFTGSQGKADFSNRGLGSLEASAGGGMVSAWTPSPETGAGAIFQRGSPDGKEYSRKSVSRARRKRRRKSSRRRAASGSGTAVSGAAPR